MSLGLRLKQLRSTLKTVAKMLSLWFLKYPVFVSPNVRESKTVLSGGISRAGFQFTGTGI